MTTTIQDVLIYIGTNATSDEIGLIYDTCKDRSKALRTVAAAVNVASLKLGDGIVLHGLSPKLLTNLCNEFHRHVVRTSLPPLKGD